MSQTEHSEFYWKTGGARADTIQSKHDAARATQAEDRITALLPDPHDTVASIHRQAAAFAEAAAHGRKRWDDPSLWKGVSLGKCTQCHRPRVLRKGLCWTCEGDHK